ncbi:hypothetical protein Trydic_g10932 [Trypoxylus dichotomus]
MTHTPQNNLFVAMYAYMSGTYAAPHSTSVLPNSVYKTSYVYGYCVVQEFLGLNGPNTPKINDPPRRAAKAVAVRGDCGSTID